MNSLTSPSICFKPHVYQWAIDFAQTSEKMHWGSWEASLQEDVRQWKNGGLTDIERAHIKQILRLFTQSDVAVGTNYVDQFLPKFKNNDIRHMLLSFANREGEHQRAYALLNDTLGFDDSEFAAFLQYKEMRDKLEFMMDSDVNTLAGLGLALAKTVINEGMSLFSAFVMLLNYQRKGKMQGMCEIVAWSVKDEKIHAEGMTRLFREFCTEHPRIVNDDFKKSIYEMIKLAVKLEDKFLDLAYAMGEPDGLTKDEVKQYIRHVADRRAIQLGLKAIYKVKQNPLPWVEWMIDGDSFANFFETRVVDYSKAGLTGDDWGYPE